MTSKEASISSPRSLPPIVFSPDDTLGAGTAPTRAVCVLIVEDDFLVAYDLEIALAEAGIEIAGVASSAEEALELADTKHPTLAVMDIRLAGKRDGVDAALDLFRTYGIRCVFATAHQDPVTRARAEPARPIAWVPKPYSMAFLVAMVRGALEDLSSGKA